MAESDTGHRGHRNRENAIAGVETFGVGAHQDVVEAADCHGEHVSIGHVAHALFAEAELGTQFVGEILIVGELAEFAPRWR